MTTRVKVATINLYSRAGRWKERRHLLIEQIVEAVPDLVSLQELHLPIRQGKWLCKQVNLRLTGSDKKPFHLWRRPTG